MRWKNFEQNKWKRVRIRPIPEMHDGNAYHTWKDIDWSVEDVAPKNKIIRLRAIGYDYVAQIGGDHILNFDTDPQRETDGFEHGIVTLKVKIQIKGVNINLEPLGRDETRFNK
ncbi:MAG TPA: hypothetical protein ENJ28_09640 [Gammaproteobacteria bacterium]|nr:hypothetical protein [Gammaproteobacteria bacterium]